MIICKSEIELDLMREAGRIVAETHRLLARAIRPDITTKELDQIAEEYIRSQGAIPSFKGYNGFPGSICASVNEELVHGIPGPRKLTEGDIISIDIGAQYKGYHGDSAWTYPVGEISETASKSVRCYRTITYMRGIAEAKPDAPIIYDCRMQSKLVLKMKDFPLFIEYVGHGIGADLHEEPQIPNYGIPDSGPRFKPGMVLAIEPMVIVGERYVQTLEDDWTVVTADGTLCAHFEHTIAITADGYEILTKPRT